MVILIGEFNSVAAEKVWSDFLWLPCVADADIIFLPCGSFFLLFFSPNLSRRMSTVLPHMVWP